MDNEKTEPKVPMKKLQTSKMSNAKKAANPLVAKKMKLRSASPNAILKYNT